MAINPLMRSSTTRLMGLSSGMDTEGIIQATLRMHQFKIDSQMRNKKMIEWRQQIHTGIKDQITSLRQTYLSNLGAKSMMQRSAFNTNVASLSTASGKSVSAVSVSASTNASLGSMTINQVVSLAKGASYTSSGKVSANGNGFTNDQTLRSLNFHGGEIEFNNYKTSVTTTDNTTISMTPDDVAGLAWSDYEKATVTGSNGNTLTITKDAGGAYSFEVKNSDGVVYDSGALNFATAEDGKISLNVVGMGTVELTENESDVNIQIKGEDDKILLSDRKMNFMREATYTDGSDEVKFEKNRDDVIANNGKVINDSSFIGEANLTINGVDIKLTSNMTLSQMTNAVNNSNAGVTLSYDRMQDRFTFESKTIGGSLADINISSDSDNLLAMLAGSGGAVATEGSMAVVIINGEEVTQSTNSFEYRGVRITLNHTTEAADEPINVTVKRDTDKAVDTIKDFINAYNTLIKKLEDLLNERKTSSEASYKPLTDEEKSSLTEKQIEEWEAIAKKGIMRSDRGIQDLVSNLRKSFFEEIEGAGLSAAQIGLSTGRHDSGTGGQIMIDEEKLRAALEADPDKVADVFIKINQTDGGTKATGLLYKLDGYMRDFVNTTQSISIKALEDSLKEANARVAKMEEKMWAEEEKLYRQFAAMETALSKLNQQGDWFSSMLGK
ncbi:MAG: flagellar filament capping protein FliD [Oscillospiraceae bacterium]|nr:flagellar filament capping protein FliD [Oscillospiraceae bacterium]